MTGVTLCIGKAAGGERPSLLSFNRDALAEVSIDKCGKNWTRKRAICVSGICGDPDLASKCLL